MNNDYNLNWFFIAVFMAMAIVFPLVPVLLARLVAPKKPGEVKDSTYECGLESKGDAWVQFRSQYYIYALIFVIFDIEVVFLFPWAVAFGGLSLGAFAAIMLFVLLLVEGLAYAWMKGVLDWRR
jgi:NADH:ubiquinone oxidoreductase subunit 3 (subunit A)